MNCGAITVSHVSIHAVFCLIDSGVDLLWNIYGWCLCCVGLMLQVRTMHVLRLAVSTASGTIVNRFMTDANKEAVWIAVCCCCAMLCKPVLLQGNKPHYRGPIEQVSSDQEVFQLEINQS